MKKNNILFVFLLLSLSLYAGSVTEQQALEKAQLFMMGKKLKVVKPLIHRARSFNSSAKINDALYIFNVENNGGFVIVSGDDRTKEILGYSDKGHIDYGNIPDNMRAWLEGYSEEISNLGQRNPIKKEEHSSLTPIKPLIQTKWGQGEPYNWLCPIHNDKFCFTGCLPTAIAQILYYHKWPQKILPSLEGYKYEGYDVEEIGETLFEWDKMKCNYKEDYSREEAMAVAELMRYCGQSMQTWYYISGSITSWWSFGGCFARGDLTNLFTDVFGYNVNTVTIRRNYFQTKVWEGFIYNEISEGRPVLYSGDGNGSHMFICDGYDENGLFHINWGWNGTSDGYFCLSIYDTDDSILFPSFHQAIIGIRPSKDNEEPLKTDNSIFEPEAAHGGVLAKDKAIKYYRNSSDVDFCDVTIRKRFYNMSDNPFEGQFGLALFKDGYDDSNLVKILEEKPLYLQSYNLHEEVSNISFGANLPNGIYLLSLIAKREKCDKWYIPNPGMWYVHIEDDSLSLFGTDNYYEEQFIIHNIKLPDEIVEGEPVSITIDYTNISCDSEIGFYLYDSDVVLKRFDIHSDPGQRNIESFNFIPLNKGERHFSLKGFKQYVYWEKTVIVSPQKEDSGVTSFCYSDTAFDVYDLQGKRIYSNMKSLDSLPRGLYVVNGNIIAR